MTAPGQQSHGLIAIPYRTIRDRQIQQIERDREVRVELHSAWAYTCSSFITYSLCHRSKTENGNQALRYTQRVAGNVCSNRRRPVGARYVAPLGLGDGGKT
jgi:hypothetical protein